MTIKVSVVVATYNSPPELDRLVAALDSQSLPTSEFEVVFVDDGSTDGTFDRLRKIAASRTNVVIESIENSGWPGRPRNIGTALAQGEYVFYSDHDDYIFPEALERMYNFAADNDLDIVHPKEVVQGWSAPGWVTWRQQRSRADPIDQTAIQCITPHKLYRRNFLNTRQITFPEGRIRMEDFSFNAMAWVRTDAIGIMSDYPAYTWILYAENSHKKGYDYEVYWDSFKSSLQPILKETAPGEKRNHLLVRWYRSRIIERLDGQFSGNKATYRAKLLKTFAELLPLFPEELDAYLNAADRARSYLLRQNEADKLVELSAMDRGMKLAATDLRTKWVDGALHLLLTARMIDDRGRPFLVENHDGKVRRAVPESLRSAAPERVWDLTGELESAFAEFVIRSRTTHVDWILQSSSDFEVVDVDGGQTIEFRAATAINPRSAAMGQSLDPAVWDVFYRVAGFGYTRTHRVPLLNATESAALLDGTTAVAYGTNTGFLALDTEAGVRTVAGTARPTISDVKIGLAQSSIGLPQIHVRGITDISGTVFLGERSFPARLVGSANRARIQISARLSGRGDVRAAFQGRRSAVLFALEGRNIPFHPTTRIFDSVWAAIGSLDTYRSHAVSVLHRIGKHIRTSKSSFRRTSGPNSSSTTCTDRIRGKK